MHLSKLFPRCSEQPWAIHRDEHPTIFCHDGVTKPGQRSIVITTGTSVSQMAAQNADNMAAITHAVNSYDRLVDVVKKAAAGGSENLCAEARGLLEELSSSADALRKTSKFTKNETA